VETTRTQLVRLLLANALAFALGLAALLLLDWLWVWHDFKDSVGEIAVLGFALVAFAGANWIALPIRNRVTHAFVAVLVGALMTALATLPALAIMYHFHFIIGGSE